MENFRRPYYARSISDFWHRWHISLSTWFRDYVYVPLGGSRVSESRWHFNILVVFVLSGLWHGASWTFVIWGALHATYLVIGRLTAGGRERLASITGMNAWPVLQRVIATATTRGLVFFAWIFFRAETLSDAMLISLNLGTGLATLQTLSAGDLAPVLYGHPAWDLLVAFASILLLEGVHLMQSYGPVSPRFGKWPIALRWLVYYAVIFSIISFGVFDQKEFIYFQF